MTQSQTLITVQEYAEKVGKSERAIRKGIASGKIPAEKVPHPKRADQYTYMIAEPDCGTSFAEPIAEPDCGTSFAEPIAEPGCGTSFAEPIAEPDATDATTLPAGTNQDRVGPDAEESANASGVQVPATRHQTPAPSRNRAPKPSLITQAPSLPAPTKKSRLHGQQEERTAALKALLCDDVIALESTGKTSRAEAIKAVLDIYHAGLAHQSLFAKKGELSPRTVYSWLQAYKGKDHMQLAERYSPRRGHQVPYDDLSFITGYMMNSSDRKLRSGIRLLHYWNRKRGVEMSVSDRTLERAFHAWTTCNHAVYSLSRYGEKYMREKLLPMQEMDWSLVNPGDLWMSDGHKLNFPVINPFTGNAERPTLITWFDAATRFPCGFDIDFTENSRIIMSSFLNALCYTGYCPKYIKLDNGKAFRSKELSRKPSKADMDNMQEEERILETMISGALYRCGTENVSFGIPYNSTSKAILERWHGTLDRGIESLTPQYSGNSVANKPARMSRNEKFLQRLESGGALTLMETKHLLNEWILEIYAREEHAGLSGRTPWDAYSESLPRIPAEQKKSPQEFWWLMLGTEVKKLSGNGVRLRDIDYWAEELINYVGQQVTVRYEQMDDRFVYIFRSDGELICRAEAQSKSDPLATVRPGGEHQAMEITNRIRQKRSLEKRIRIATAQKRKLTFQEDDLIQSMISGSAGLSLTSSGARVPALPLPAVPAPQEDEPDNDSAVNDFYRNLGLD